MVTFTGLEIFFIATTVFSIVMNVLQWQEAKASKEPLSNALVGTFNDIKSMVNGALFAYNSLFNPNNPHKDVNTLRWEYGLTQQNMINSLQGLQEQIVAVLVSLRPDDKAGKLAFRATDYGLTEQDKELRRANFEKFMAQLTPVQPAPLAQPPRDS